MNLFKEFNWPLVILWLILCAIGLTAIYSATQGPVSQFLPTYIQQNFYKQIIWIVVSIGLMIAMQFIPPKTFEDTSYFAYAFALLLMVATLIFGREINGAKSWLYLGPVGFQTSELGKIATILAVSNYLSTRRDISQAKIREAITATCIILLPTFLVLAQNDTGTALVFISLIPVMLFWSGMPYSVSLFMISPAVIGYLSIIGWYWGLLAAIIITICVILLRAKTLLAASTAVLGGAIILGVQLALTKVLKPHQVGRVMAFVDPSFDPQGAGWNVIQAKTAIGSGGLTGKGFLEGTQTQLRFLPEQWTDFIFCVVGEEFGFIGASILVLTFLFLLLRLLNSTAHHKYPFAQLVIVGFTSVFFIHFFINVGMTSAMLPIIGIPLPFVSYGGSAFLTNTIMLAICLNLDLYKRSFSIYT